jgi:HSP20 family protein
MIARWIDNFDPIFSDFTQLRDELDRLFDIGLPFANIRSVPRGTFPAINLYEDKDTVEIFAYVPGIDQNKIELSLQDNVLTIKGERETVRPGDKAHNYHRRERFSGAFTRIVSLPEGLDPNKVSAKYNDGILHVSIHKMEARKPKQIAVKIA